MAQSLNIGFYYNSPRFIRFNESEEIGFKPYTAFNKQAIQERQGLYKRLAEKIWGVETLDEV